MSIRKAAETTPVVDSATTTVPPARPTSNDMDTLVALHEAEVAARDLYQKTIDAASVSDPDKLAIVTLLREHHRAYAQALAAILAKKATNLANAAIYDANVEAFGSSTKFAEAAFALENTLIATHTAAVGTLEGTEGAALIASIIITEGRHAVVVAELAGKQYLDAQLAGATAK